MTTSSPPPALYGGTITQLDVTLRRFGVDTTFVPGNDPADFAAAITAATKLVFAEVVANPSGAVADLAGLAEVAHAAGVPLVVDATMATPYLCRPIEHGADIVVHSATKFLGGHGTTIGGVVVESGTFDWGNGRFPPMTEPCRPTAGSVVGQLRRVRLPHQAAHRAAARRRRHAVPAQRLPAAAGHRDAAAADGGARRQRPARSPSGWPPTSASPGCRYAGLPGHPDHAARAALPPEGPGRGVRFGVVGGRDAGRRFIESVELCSHLANIGDARTLVHPPRRPPRTGSCRSSSWRPRACRRTWSASRSGWRTSTTSCGTSTRRSPRP